jgi:hypothetical protein
LPSIAGPPVVVVKLPPPELLIAKPEFPLSFPFPLSPFYAIFLTGE